LTLRCDSVRDLFIDVASPRHIVTLGDCCGLCGIADAVRRCYVVLCDIASEAEDLPNARESPKGILRSFDELASMPGRPGC
jgi:hypothetical protein